ncbi:MAG: hypothetical protein ACR2FU_06510 [Streptosporangiaceae bacterium]
MTGMTGAAALERRYRRLLAWYPAGHQRAYGEEMVGVLLASARDGQRGPRPAEIADLAAGAGRAWLRTAVRGRPDPGWRDALAIVSLLAGPLLSVLLIGQNLGWMAALLWQPAPGAGSEPGPWWPVAVLLAPLALGLLGPRRAGAVLSALTLAWVAGQASLGGRLGEPRLAAYLVLLGVQAVALAASPGPRRALTTLSARSVLVALPWLAATAYAAGIVPGHLPVPLAAAQAGVGVAALTGLATLLSPGGRRVLLLLAGIPGSAFAVSVLTFARVDFYSMSGPAAQVALYGPPLALAGLAALAIRRTGRRPQGAEE